MKYFIKTFGCQMNEADSEQIAASLEQQGYQPANSIEQADLVVINTCSVRQSAENRVGGLVNNLKKLKIENCPGKTEDSRQSRNKLKIILTGCMLRYTRARLEKLLPGVDEFVKLKDLVAKDLDPKFYIRSSKVHAWVPIMQGCDNFCTYCVVPSARGREVSRPLEEIICEVKTLVRRGHKHITLLGQNVNSYHKNAKFPPKTEVFRRAGKIKKLQQKYTNKFALLLALLNDISGLQKISFLTSNPHDMTDDIIEAMSLPKVDRYLHLALQSGDDAILKHMNRKYTAEQYLALVKKIRGRIPEIELGTDIIVGFPGETRVQFNNTVKLCRQIKFKQAYINKYSPRPGTPAYRFKDNISPQEKKRRWRILNELVNVN